MSKINADTIKTSNPNIDITLGAAGDAVLIPTGATLKNNTIKDSGGNTIFQSDGSGTLSNVNSAFDGSNVKLLTTQTFTAQSSVSFTTNIDTTYNFYMFTWHSITASVAQAFFTFNGSTDGGSTYSIEKCTGYFYTQNYEDGSPAGALNYSSTRDLSFADSDATYQKLDADNAATQGTDGCSTGRIYLWSPASINGAPTNYGGYKYFSSRSSNMAYDSSGLGNTSVFVSGFFNTQSAVNAIDFKMDSGTFSGTMNLYGIG